MSRVIVCGGRDFLDRDGAYHWLDSFQLSSEPHAPITVLLSGGAQGADELGARWARKEGIECVTFPANWKRLGKSAGPIRNQQMLDEGKADAVIAFPGGRGTADMTQRARSAGLTVYEAKP